MIELGLSRIHQLLAQTPLPWRAIHVAGTNGKGSVCAYVSAMLGLYNRSQLRQQTGHSVLRHGRFVSPHLIDRWDCITIDGQTIDKDLFDSAEARVLGRNEVEKIKASEFEILTATAFEIFTESRLDIGVIEVGMGGRLDSTNILGQDPPSTDGINHESRAADFRPPPLVTGITSIGLDHQNFLGNTISDIAREKAGILKAGVPAVMAAEDPNVVSTIKTQAETVGASGVTGLTAEATPASIWQQYEIDLPSSLDLEISAALHRPIQKRWPNGAIALNLVWESLTALERLHGVAEAQKLDLMLEMAKIPGLTEWPGRLQKIDISSLTGLDTPVLLDGAHNAQSAQVLSRFVREQTGEDPIQWVLAASEGKDIEEMLRILVRPGDSVAAVEFGEVDGMPWVKSKSSDAIAAEASRISQGLHAAYGRDVLKGLRMACQSAKSRNHQVVIAGSLYLVGEVLRLRRSHDTQVNSS